MRPEDLVSSARDPLDFDIRSQCRVFLQKVGRNIPNVQDKNYLEGILVESPESTIPGVLSIVSRLMTIPAFTTLVADTFRPLLMDLCARLLYDDSIDEVDRLAALCLLVEPYEEIFPILASYVRHKSLSHGPLAFTTQPGLVAADIPTLHLQRILVAYYRLLAVDPALPTCLGWSATLLQGLFRPVPKASTSPHPDRAVRWLAIRCFGLQTRLSEIAREKLETEFVGAYGAESLQLHVGQGLVYDQAGGAESLTAKDITLDACAFPIAELRRIHVKREELVAQSVGRFFNDDSQALRISQSDLCPSIVNIAGILLYTSSALRHREQVTPYVPTPTTTNALRALALQLSQRIPTLLSAAPASGKMTLLRELARRIHPEGGQGLVVLQLADTSLDAKSLLGSYVSASTTEESTGGFKWQDGAVPRALRLGKWLVLADVDRASTEVLATVLPLIESMRPGKFIGQKPWLDLGGGRGRVQGGENFMLFGMRSVTKLGADELHVFPPPTFFGHKHWFEVQLLPPSAEELVSIVGRRFPRLGSAVPLVVEFWKAMKEAAYGLPKTRDIGMRDLDKFCARLEQSLPPAASSASNSFVGLFPNHVVREEILLEARDVFFAAYEIGTAHFDTLATCSASILGLDGERVTWALTRRTPQYSVRKTGDVVVGRSQLSPAPLVAISPAYNVSRPFALHRPALTLLESISASVHTRESILLVGETGTGKTTSVQHAAQLTHTPLVVLNLSNQSEASDLLGGFRPVDARIPAAQIQEKFVELFGETFSRKKNRAFEDAVRAAYAAAKWTRAVKLWREAGKMAGVGSGEGTGDTREAQADGPRKRRKLSPEWEGFVRAVDEFDAAHVRGRSNFVFSFVEGPLVTALRNGHWILLDEVNLASSETLECVASILQGPNGSVTLAEAGQLEPIPRHPDFRLFACMNPATDAGKKDLPPNIRSRFTEFYVPPPDADEEALRSMVQQYIGHCALGDKTAITDVADFYITAKRLTAARQLADGQNHVPHFSMRTLARALTFASDLTPTMKLRRALWEGVTMAFMMTLDVKSAATLRATAEKHILGGVKNLPTLLNHAVPPPEKDAAEKYIQFGPFWLLRGPEQVQSVDEYILTPSVQTKLVDLARIVTTRRFPVLIEGPTSSGKTSSIEYLAKRTGHRFVRINNHEHTDLQEYLGSYMADSATGKLKFHDGILVRALRAGDWIVLDELNLAPTDVLEALNRLLDDNRELVVPETGEVIRPHPNFMLFATQNPPGLYAGRKVLSRAFRNRFLEVHFDDVPQDELETILCRRCGIAQSHGRKIVAVFQELQKRRQAERVFETKNSFVTLRDLFRWANRHSEGYVDNGAGGNYQHIAEQGYMLLAERARRADDRAVVKSVIEDIMKVKIDEQGLYDLNEQATQRRIGAPAPTQTSVVWTAAMRRLFTLVATALRYNEPVLLIGETGSGKTSVCELLALALNRPLYSLSCHQNTETADLLGSQRPLRNRGVLRETAIIEALNLLHDMNVIPTDSIVDDMDHTIRLVEATLKSCPPDQCIALRQALSNLNRSASLFEWHDGPLIQAMEEGGLFLLDEISLADDSVLERLNSVLEPSRQLVLAEKGGNDFSILTVTAQKEFQLIATMNPGGDYGKKELSPALRNRFTEIWVPHVDERDDLHEIIQHSWKDPRFYAYTPKLIDFAESAGDMLKDKNALGLRDLLAWVSFSNCCASTSTLEPDVVFHHAARMAVLDGLPTLGSVASLPPHEISRLLDALECQLKKIVPLSPEQLHSEHTLRIGIEDSRFWVGPFSVPVGNIIPSNPSFSLQAPTTRMNASRVVRALQIPKPLLLEGSPGVGKTSLIVSLAAMSGHSLCRINLSDQTDLIDLFGSDMPVEGGNPGEFAWRDAAFLRAMQNGDWVLLDEMNLAPQAVLEGLNAVLDHRGTVLIPELGREFTKHPDFRVFAAQNPLGQGGGRKGLPKSFVNRFTKVYVEALSRDDLQVICTLLEPTIPDSDLIDMLTFNDRLCEEVITRARFGGEGSPWEFNLRDLVRWMSLWKSPGVPSSRSPLEYIDDAYLARFRSGDDRHLALNLYGSDEAKLAKSQRLISLGLEQVQFGHTLSSRRANLVSPPLLSLPRDQAFDLEIASKCIDAGWLLILNGPSYSGKTSLVRALAALRGAPLNEFYMSTGTDTTDLLGGFEHANLELKLKNLLIDIGAFMNKILVRAGFLDKDKDDLMHSLTSTLASPTPHGERIAHTLQELKRLLQEFPYEGLDGVVASIDRFLQEGPSSNGRFEWVDGPLVKAMKEGSWLVLDHCNLCSPAVLDRLNSLCEAGGVLVLSEKGTVDGEIPVIVPHPDFRLFMSLNPRYGELSRAMRNRGVELTLSPIGHVVDYARIRQSARLSSSFDATQDSLVQDNAVVQLYRRGLITSNINQTTNPIPMLPNLVLATSDYRAFQLASILSMLDEVPPEETEHSETARILFLASSVPRESLHALSYHLDALGHGSLSKYCSQLADHQILRVRDEIQAQVEKQRGVSSRFLLSQPVLLHLNTNIMSAAFTPGLCYESELQELALEAVARVYSSRRIEPLTSMPSEALLSIMDKSRLIWGGLGATVTVPRCVRSIAPLSAALHDACTIALNVSDVLGNQRTIELIQHFNDCVEVLQHISKTPFVDFAAIRAIAQLICGAFDTLGAASDQFNEASTMSRNLLHDTELSTGKAMLQLWPIMQLPERESAAKDPASKLLDLLSRFPPLRRDARREALDVAAMLCIQESHDLIECTNKLATVESEPFIPELDAAASATGRQEICLSMLNVLSGILRGTSSSRTNNLFLDIACSILDLDLSTLIPLRMLLWESELPSKPNSVPDNFKSQILFGSHVRWMQSTWLISSRDAVTSGPQAILMSVEYPASLLRCDPSSVGLAQYTLYREKLHVQRMQLKSQAHLPSSERLLSLATIWLNSVSLIMSTFHSESTDPERLQMASIHDRLLQNSSQQSVRTAIIEAAECMRGSSSSVLTRAAHKHLTPLQNTSAQASELSMLIGEAWIGSSRMLLELYLPDVPMDPLGGEGCQRYLWDSRATWLQEFMRIIESGKHFSLCANYEPLLGRLRTRLNTAQAQKDLLKPNAVRKPEHLRELTEMFAESHAFLAQAVESSRISQLIRNLQSRATNAFAQEELVQETITTFLQRLHQSYPNLSDIILPLEYALHQLKLGLRLYAFSISRHDGSYDSVSLVVQSLLYRPSILSSQKLLELEMASLVPVTQNSVSSAEWILAKIISLLHQRAVESPSSDALRPLVDLYDLFLDLWLSQKARESRAEAESQSLYKQSKLESSGSNEESELEQEFNELFPSFGDLMDETGLAPTTNTTNIARNAITITSVDIQTIHRLHSIWAHHSFDSPAASPQIHSNRSQNIDTLLARIVRDHGNKLTAAVDSESFSQRVRIFQASNNQLGSTVAQDFDFYHDSSISELDKAARLLDAFCGRLDALIVEWPDQMVLRHLLERCQAIQQLRLDTPLAKVLSALEQLLLHTADWETYANKDNTLRAQQQQLTDLIVDWRRLELKCWSTLLDRELASSADAVSTWWPQLYESVVNAIATLEDDQTKLATHLEQLVPLLDSYFSQSPLGQFEPRLALLQSFAKLTRHVAKESASPRSFSQVSDLLQCLCVQYTELLPQIRDSLKQQRATIDKEISDFIKLASWKDTNVHALKQSAEKTHRVLYKCVRKFRDIIRQPVSEILSSQAPSEPFNSNFATRKKSPEAFEVSLITRPEAEQSSPIQHINVMLALQNYQTHARGSGVQLVRNNRTEFVHSLATRIIDESKELADTVIPESDARERHIKSLLSRKRRAWSDLLKELKRLGLSVGITTEALSQQEDRAGLLSIHLDSNNAGEFTAAISRANVQFTRLLKILPDMRASLSHHHSDISTRDLRRACNLVESSFSSVIEARKILKGSLGAYSQLQARLERMADIRTQLAGGGLIFGAGGAFYATVKSTRGTIGQIHSALVELVEDIAQFESATDSSSTSTSTKELLNDNIKRAAEIFAKISQLEMHSLTLGTVIWTQDEASTLHDANGFVSRLKSTFQDLDAQHAVPLRVFEPYRNWFNSLGTPAPPAPMAQETSTLHLADQVISKLLVSMQAIVAARNPTLEVSQEYEVPDKAIRVAAEHTKNVASILGIENVDRAITELSEAMPTINADQISYSVERLTPFLQLYLAVARESLSETLAWLGSVSRLTITLATTVHTLMQKGFCKPPDIQDESEGSKDGQELSEGTGMGEGAGAENISNQIEDEAQVEGLKGENDSGPKGDKNDDDDAIEMTEDFAGDMEDVSGDEEDEGDSKSGSEADPEERIENLDSADPDVVDEKLWNNESAEDKPEGQDQGGKDTQPGEQSETAAKEDKPEQSKNQPKADEAEQTQDGDESNQDAEEGMEEEENQTTDGRKMDDYVPEANTLDLPDDINLDQDEKEASEAGEEIGDEDTVMGDEESIGDQDMSESAQEPDQDPESADAPTDHDATIDDVQPEDDSQGGEQKEPGVGRQDTRGGDNQDTGAPSPDEQVGSSSGAAQGKGHDGSQEQQEETTAEANPEAHDQSNDPSNDSSTDQGNTGTQARAANASQQQNQPSSNYELPNPLRSMGDASKEIQRRVDEILNRQDAQSTPADPAKDTEVEYMQDDDEDHEMQALGPSNETEEATRLRDLRIDDIPAAALDEPMADIEPDATLESSEMKQPETRMDSALTAEDVRRLQASRPGPIPDADQPQLKQELELEEPVDSTVLERTVAEWEASGHVQDAEEIWRMYENLTRDASHALCEQLRLILAPTRATRLRGDFRTGKRLNMKKLVPYVASDFTRDKIWLRRTRPAAREYQVLLAVDDSRSMARASHTVHLTRQALALVSRALEKLEVGELALAKFGREMEVVHEFGAGVLRGGAALEQFTFDQPATDVLRLIESSLDVLQKARERGSGSSDLWQLEIVISDGICQDHARLQTVLRRAEEERVMVVFIVVDAPTQDGTDGSIVSMLQPSIKMVDGRMDIQMERYLDTFPFRYFVVLRDVDALPSVLAGTLRQFFERISED